MGTAVFYALFPLAYPGDRSGRPATSGGLNTSLSKPLSETANHSALPAILAHHPFEKKE